MAREGLTAKELADWITPAVALNRLKVILGSESLAAQAIVERLAGNMIVSGASTGLTAPRDESERHVPNVLIPHHHWKLLPGGTYGHSVWKTAQFDIWTDRGETHISYFGVKIDPVGIAYAISQMGPIQLAVSPQERARDKGGTFGFVGWV
jgi:hypothetical protein